MLFLLRMACKIQIVLEIRMRCSFLLAFDSVYFPDECPLDFRGVVDKLRQAYKKSKKTVPAVKIF